MEKLLDTLATCRAILSEEIINTIREYGHDITDEETETFYLQAENATKIINFYEKGGCSSVEQIRDDSEDILGNFDCAEFYCIYIVKLESGDEIGRYYCLHNAGVCVLDDAEIYYGFLSDLSLTDLENISKKLYEMF